MISYRATLDVPPTTLATVSRWILDHRRRHDIRPWQRAGTCRTQALLVLRWLKDATDLFLLARDSRVSVATAYRYPLDVIAQRMPDLPTILEQGREAGWEYVCLDGTLIETTRCTVRSDENATSDLWFSGKHKRHGGNIQVVTDPTGYPVWVSPVEPGSTHDITTARAHALPALYAAAGRGMPTLTDKGYIGAGIGILIPDKGRDLPTNTQSRNKIIGILRAPAERANAPLKSTWTALRRVTLSPQRITVIIAAAFVLLHIQRGTW